MTIIKIVEKVYNNLPEYFNIYSMILSVKDYPEQSTAFDSAILKMLNNLRNDNKINYKVLNKRSGEYKKL